MIAALVLEAVDPDARAWLSTAAGGHQRRPPVAATLAVTSRTADATRPRRLSSRPSVYYSNANIRFQSFLILMTVQPFCFASSYSAWVEVSGLCELGYRLDLSFG